MELFGQLAVQLVVSVVGGAVAALLTVWLSLRRFYREKWWERKMAAYASVIESLHHARRSLEAGWKEEVEGKHYDEAYMTGLRKKSSLAWAELHKNTDIGEFLFSFETVEALRAFHQKVEAATDPNSAYFEYAEAALAAIDELLPRIKRLARADLGLSLRKRSDPKLG